MLRNRSTAFAATLLALAVTITGCSRKADDAAQQNAGPAPGAEQAQDRPAQKAEGKRAEKHAGKSARDGWGDQGTQGGQAYTSDKFSKQAAAPQVHNYTVDAGSNVVVRTITALTTKTAKAGDRFEASLEQPLVAGDYTVAPKGATVFGEVTLSDPSGKLKGSSLLGVRLTSLSLPNGDRIALQTSVAEKISQGTGKKTAAKVGIGAAAGAIIGAIAGGGKGAAIGAASGGAVGGGVAYATGGNPAVIPSETVLTFQLTAPVTVTSRN